MQSLNAFTCCLAAVANMPGELVVSLCSSLCEGCCRPVPKAGSGCVCHDARGAMLLAFLLGISEHILIESWLVLHIDQSRVGSLAQAHTYSPLFAILARASYCVGLCTSPCWPPVISASSWLPSALHLPAPVVDRRLCDTATSSFPQLVA